MRTLSTIQVRAEIAIVTKHSVSFWEAILSEPEVELPTTSGLLSVLNTAAFDMVHRKEFNDHNITTGTLTERRAAAVVLHGFHLQSPTIFLLTSVLHFEIAHWH